MPRNFGTILVLFTYLLTNLQVVMQVHTCEVSGVSWQWQGAASPACCAPQQEPLGCPANGKSGQAPTPEPGCCETEQIDLRLGLPQQVAKVLVLSGFTSITPVLDHRLLPEPYEPQVFHAWFIDPPPPKVGLWRQHCASLTYG